jgi:hypothetical protein
VAHKFYDRKWDKVLRVCAYVKAHAYTCLVGESNIFVNKGSLDKYVC